MMLRGSISALNSSSKNLSLSSSWSSVLPPHSSVNHVSTAQLKDRDDDIESYLSVCQQKQVGRSHKKIDWAKLMDSEGEDGDERVVLELEGGTSTSTFLKPKVTQASRSRGQGGDSSRAAELRGKPKYQNVAAGSESVLQNISRREKQHSLATKSHHLMARDVQNLEADSWNHGSSDALDTSSLSDERTEQSDSFEEDKLRGSNSESDWSRHPHANVRTAGETDECSEQGAELVTGAKSKFNAEVQDPILCMQNNLHSENEETESESSCFEQLQLTRNVFSIDQLEAALESHSDRTSTDKNGSGLANFRNLCTLDDLELADIHTGKNTEPVTTFRSGRAVTAAGTSETKVVFPRSPTKVGEGYSDEEFESVCSNSSDIVEEDIAEELSESCSADVKTKKNVISKSDRVVSRDIAIDGSPPPSMKREHGEGDSEDRVPGFGGMGSGGCKHNDTLWEDYSEFSEIEQHASGTAQDSHPARSQPELSSSLDRTSTLSQDHSVGLKVHKNKCQSTGASDVRDASVQTSSAAAAHALPIRYGHPSPIVPHMVSTDALQEVTMTSPAMVALNHLLRNQLALTQHFLATSRHVTEQLSSGSVSDHQYTTLEETKDYISKHRPKVLTTKEAKKLVAMEALRIK